MSAGPTGAGLVEVVRAERPGAAVDRGAGAGAFAAPAEFEAIYYDEADSRADAVSQQPEPPQNPGRFRTPPRAIHPRHHHRHAPGRAARAALARRGLRAEG